MNRLTLTAASLEWSMQRGRPFRRRIVQAGRTFDDLVVDGTSLRQWFGLNWTDKMMTPLSTDSAEAAALAVQTLNELLGDVRGPYQDGCIPLLICGIDNDAYCGTLGARAEPGPQSVRWEFGWHLLDPGEGSVQAHQEPEPAQPREFLFDRREYMELLRPARDRYQAAARGATAYPFLP